MSLKELIKPLYLSLPPICKMSRSYRKMYKFYNQSQWWTKEAIELWQLRKFKEIISYAYNNVSGYQQLYKESGISPNDINNLNDINLFPFTNKTLIRDNLKEFTSRKISKRQMSFCTTSGSTGIPFGFYYSKKSSDIELSFIHNAWSLTGWRINDLGIIEKV